MALKFTYCECGCHGSSADAGTVSFWIYNDLKGSFFLHKGHGHLDPKVGTYTSFEEATKSAEYLVRVALTEMQVALDT